MAPPTAPGLAGMPAGDDLMLSFPTTGPGFYTVQSSRDLLHWTSSQQGVPGDGTVKTLRMTNALSTGLGFYRVAIQMPMKLLLPQSNALAILGYDCGGIREQVSAGFDPGNGYPRGVVALSTSCSTGKAGSPPSVHNASAAVTWDFAGNVITAVPLTNGVTANPTTANDTYGDAIYNSGSAAYLLVPVPAAPAGVSAVQSNDQFQVSWTATGVNPAAIISSTLTATPINSTDSVLTAAATGPAATGTIPSLQPQTTYQITVVNTTIGGSGPPSAPIRVTTFAATIAPSAPTQVTATWPPGDPSGAVDTLTATWQAPNPGNSPIDQYLVTITGSDGAGTVTQTVPATTLTASFTVDYIPNWSVTVQAHNAAGWGPLSAAFSLGGL